MIPLGQPTFGEEELKAISRPIRKGWVMQGKEVSAFESAIADYCGSKHGLAVSSGTSALHLSLLAAGVGPGDEVILPALTYVATANAVCYCGGTPVFVDVKSDDFTIDPDLLESALGPKTKAIIPVHLFGRMADMETVSDLAAQHELMVIEDAAGALGSAWRSNMAGTMGHMGILSFHPRKLLCCGEGGMVLTDREDLAAQIDVLRNQGREPGSDDYAVLGYNYRMTDLQGALGCIQASRLDELLSKRAALAKRYGRLLKGLPHIELPIPFKHEEQVCAYQAFVILIDKDAPLTQGELIKALADRGIQAGMGSHSVPVLKYYRQRFDTRPEQYPQALKVHQCSLALPFYTHLSESDQDLVVDALREILKA